MKPKKRGKSKIMLHGYKYLYSLHETEDINVDIAKDGETRFDTSNHELDRPLPKGKNTKVNGLMKDELSGKIMTEISYIAINI